MDIEEIYEDSKPLVITDCEFAHEINDIMYSSKIKDEIKSETSNTTNIIVTKYADSTSSDILDVEPTLDLENKEKIIEVELLSSELQHKNNFSGLLNGDVSKKCGKRKIEIDENKKFSLSGFKKKRLKQCSSFSKDFIETIDLDPKSDFDESNSQEFACSECNKQFSTAAFLVKHLSTCKAQSLGTALCSKCGKNFSSNYNLKRHMTSCKLCPDNEKSPRFTCQCGRSYSQEWDMKKHKLKCKDGKKKCKQCLVANCNLLFYHKAQLIAHMKKDHNMVIQDPKVLNFNSFSEFLMWKEKEEEETFTYYSKQTGSNVSGVSVNTYYICQHDGSDRTHNSAPRKTERRNKKGRIKTGRLCWSQMNVKEFKDGTVKVTYFPSHTHPVSIADTEHHPLPFSISMEIKRRISEMTKTNENEDSQSVENQELKKSRRKRYGMSLRALRALARKNRSLFRITAEAVKKTENKDLLDVDLKTDFQYTPEKILSNDNVMQVFMSDKDDNPDDPDPVQMFDVSNSNNNNDLQNANEELLEDCITYLNDVRTHLLSGKLPQSQIVQIKESLKNICSIWKNEAQEDPLEIPKPQDIPESQDMMMYPSEMMNDYQTEIFPLQDDISTSAALNDDLKRAETPEKTVYQIITVDGEEKSSNPIVYENTLGVIGTREFIIIAGEHAQVFHSVDSNIQLNLQ